MDFETAVKLIPLYGDAKNDDLQAYIDAVSFVIDNCEASDKKKYLSIAKIRLRGEVGAAVRRNELVSWTDLKAFLRERGDKQQSESYIEDQLIYVRQGPKETIREFADKIEKLGHKLIIAQVKSGIDSKAAEGSAERRMHKSFTRGVNEPIKSVLLNRKTSSFNDAVKDSLSLELEFEEDRSFDGKKRLPAFSNSSASSGFNSFSDRKCFKCNQPGHKAINCRNKHVKAIAGDVHKASCYNCGRAGHFARDCRLPRSRSFENRQPWSQRDHNAARGNNSSGARYYQGNEQRLPSTFRTGKPAQEFKSEESKEKGKVY